MAESLRPVDGQFVHPPSVRRKWCRENGHPLALLNITESAKTGQRVQQCICGKRKESNSANTKPTEDAAPAGGKS
jgi:hypothetical protein